MKFTKDVIERSRKAAVFLGEPGTILFLQALDEIERLRNIVEAHENEIVLLDVTDKLKNETRIAELEQVSEDQALTISQNDYAYTIDKEMMETEIKESNDLLRSAWMIAKRDGKETNWEAFRGQLDIALERQHKMMYKQQEE